MCPKCGCKVMKDNTDGHSCMVCGKWFPAKIEAPKVIDIHVHCSTFEGWSEPNQAAKMRCEHYFEKYKHTIKNELMKGKTFKAIWIELNENCTNLPSRSWLRKTYLDWVKGEPCGQ